MKEKRNTEWGEGQEKWSDRELLQLSFFPSIWRAQRKIGDEYGGSSSHSLLTFFSWIPSTFFFFFQHFHSSVSISFIIPVFNPSLPVRYLYSSFPCDPIIHILFPSFLQIFFPSSLFCQVVDHPAAPPPHLSFFINFLLISFVQSLKPPQPPLSLALSLILWHTFYSSSLHPLVHITISFFLLPCVCLFIYRPLPFLSCGYAVAGACVCEHSYPSRALPFTQDQLVFLSLHLSHTYWHKHTHTHTCWSA